MTAVRQSFHVQLTQASTVICTPDSLLVDMAGVGACYCDVRHTQQYFEVVQSQQQTVCWLVDLFQLCMLRLTPSQLACNKHVLLTGGK